MRKILQGARKAAGMTQKQTAQTVGVSERYYQHIEAGTREGKARVWDRLEERFGLPQRQLRKDCGNDTTFGASKTEAVKRRSGAVCR